MAQVKQVARAAVSWWDKPDFQHIRDSENKISRTRIYLFTIYYIHMIYDIYIYIYMLYIYIYIRI